jgi:uncharacterized repeat protein (TIGR01451 family)
MSKEKFSMKKFILLTCVVLIALTGCTCKKFQGGTQVVTKTVYKEGEPKVIIKEVGGSQLDCNPCLIKVVPNAPAESVIGQTYASDADVIALQDAGNIHLYTFVPEGVQYVRSEPPARVEGNKLMWHYDYMRAKDVQKVKVFLTANREGDVRLCYVASADPVWCVNTKIGKPELQITKTGPQTAEVNGTVTYTITVKNTGTSVARDVVITDPTPNGLQHTGGQAQLSFPVGDLAPGQSKTVQAPFKAVARGQVCNVATANSSNAGSVTARACTNILKKELNLACEAPQQGKVGQRITAKAIVTNQGDSPIEDVVLQVQGCGQAKILSSDCMENVSGNNATWRGTIAPGQTKTCTFVLVAEAEGQCCIRMTATGAGMTKNSECCTNWTGDPRIEITKTGPAEASLGQQISYTVTVRSTGTATAKNVVVVDNLPSGLAHASGVNSLRTPIGDMPPGATKTLTIPVTTKAPGRHCNVAKAESSNAGTVNAEACTVVKTRDASIEISCPSKSYVGKRAMATVQVKNTGDTALSGVTVSANAASQLTIVSAEGNPSASGNSMTWNVPSLAPGETKSYQVVIIAKERGKYCMTVAVNTAEGIRKQAECCTEWEGFPALLLEVIDTIDPLVANEETTYVIEVTNQGTAPDHNIRIDGVFPVEISPINASGDTAGTISGKKVSFAAYPILNPKEKIKWQIRAKAVQPGDSRLKIYLSSELLKTPVTEEESTHVY